VLSKITVIGCELLIGHAKKSRRLAIHCNERDSLPLSSQSFRPTPQVAKGKPEFRKK